MQGADVVFARLLDECRVEHWRPQAAGAQAKQVVFGVDSAFFRHAWVTLLSIIEANPDSAFHFHFISMDSLPLAEVADACDAVHTRCAITGYQVPKAAFDTIPQSPHFPKAACLRLLAPFLLRDREAVLYLDADIVCLGSLARLWSERASDQAIVAVVEDCPATALRQSALLGLRKQRYFNSGVMYIQVNRWLQAQVTERVLDILRAQGHRLRFPDQDALNLVLEGVCDYLPQAYNQQFTLGHKPADYVRAVPEGAVLLHYTGLDKPWQAWNEQSAVAHYRRFRARMPWKGEPYDKPSRARQARRMYKLCFRRWRLLEGSYWLVQRWRMAQR